MKERRAKSQKERKRGRQPGYDWHFVADTHDSTRTVSSSCVRSANDGEPSRVERCHVVQSDARARRPTPSHAKSVWITGTKSIYNTQLTGEGERDGSPPRLNDINMSPRETADGKTDKTAKTDDQRTGGGYYFQIKNSFFFLLLLLFSLFSLHNDDVVTWLRGVGPRSQPYGGTVKDRTAFFVFFCCRLSGNGRETQIASSDSHFSEETDERFFFFPPSAVFSRRLSSAYNSPLSPSRFSIRPNGSISHKLHHSPHHLSRWFPPLPSQEKIATRNELWPPHERKILRRQFPRRIPKVELLTTKSSMGEQDKHESNGQ